MSRHKTIFLARIPKPDKDEFYDMCDMQAVKPAEVLRRMMQNFCREMESERSKQSEQSKQTIRHPGMRKE